MGWATRNETEFDEDLAIKAEGRGPRTETREAGCCWLKVMIMATFFGEKQVGLGWPMEGSMGPLRMDSKMSQQPNSTVQCSAAQRQ